jgi:cell division septation protein DedD
MEEIRKALTQENVDVFVFVVDLILEEMNDAASELNRAAIETALVDLEDSIIRRLEDLIDAWKTPSSKPRPGNPPPPGEPPTGPRKPELVPDVVQLNLMKKLQQIVLDKTLKFRGRKDWATELSDIDRRFLGRLSEEQRKIAELMDRFIERFSQDRRGMDRKEQGISFQDEPPSDDPGLTLQEIRRLMELAEEHLHGASRKGIDPWLVESEKNQKTVIEQLERLIRESRQRIPGPPSDPTPGSSRPKPPAGMRPAPRPYTPSPSAAPGRFEVPRGGGWKVGLPAHERAKMILEMQRRDLFLPEYQDMIREFFKQIMD